MKFEVALEHLLETKTKKSKPKMIVFVEGWSRRIQAAVQILSDKHLIKPLLLFETAEQFKANPTKHEHLIISEATNLRNQLAAAYFDLRKGKEEKKEIEQLITKAPLFAAMLVRLKQVDGALGGIHYATADILRAAFKAIGPKPGVKTISSVMIMHKGDAKYLFSDISVNPDPDANQLVDIAKNALEFGRLIGFAARVAFLSFSTSGSATHAKTEIIKLATRLFNEQFGKSTPAIGEVQFDAAFDLAIRQQKYKGEFNFDGQPSVFVFPDLNAGNIGYKIAQRLGDFGAIGPIITGLNMPMNDLSRGSTVSDVVNTAILTVLQTFEEQH